jgi:hypothetical protein
MDANERRVIAWGNRIGHERTQNATKDGLPAAMFVSHEYMKKGFAAFGGLLVHR